MVSKLVRLAVLAATILGVTLAYATPTSAAVTYRDIKSVKYNRCLYAYADPLNDLYLKPCSTTPAKYGNWVVQVIGYHNNHPLWTIKREGGKCLGVLGNAASNYLYSSCTATGSRNVWEIFITKSNRYVLKSYGAYQSWGQHKCLAFPWSGGMGSAKLGACSLTNTTNQVYR